ncbi:Conserved_hypothetical protein [Hexamita inflata]|uniref:Uncharacterized protein n=1 Tax=Hexamita inflata TaxID=28002 RepID=A0AA86U925_9EUKA|nr:Conserved hypothetical protein [Hexamita inflata]
MDQLINDFADADLQVTQPLTFSQKQREKYFQTQTHQLQAIPEISDKFMDLFHKQQEINNSQTKFHRQNNELLAFQQLSKQQIPQQLDTILEHNSLLKAMNIKQQGAFNVYSNDQLTSELKALKQAASQSVVNELLNNKEEINKMNLIISTYQNCLRGSAKIELNTLNQWVEKMQIAVQNQLLTLVYNQNRNYYATIRKLLESINTLNAQLQICLQYFNKGSDYYTVLAESFQKFDSILTDELRQINFVQQLITQKENLYNEYIETHNKVFCSVLCHTVERHCTQLMTSNNKLVISAEEMQLFRLQKQQVSDNQLAGAFSSIVCNKLTQMQSVKQQIDYSVKCGKLINQIITELNLSVNVLDKFKQDLQTFISNQVITFENAQILALMIQNNNMEFFTRSQSKIIQCGILQAFQREIASNQTLLIKPITCQHTQSQLYVNDFDYRQIINNDNFEPCQLNSVFIPVCYQDLQKSVDLTENNQQILTALLSKHFALDFSNNSISILSNQQLHPLSSSMIRILLALQARDQFYSSYNFSWLNTSLRLQLFDLSILQYLFTKLYSFLNNQQTNFNTCLQTALCTQSVFHFTTFLIENEKNQFTVFSNKLHHSLNQFISNSFKYTVQIQFSQFSANLVSFIGQMQGTDDSLYLLADQIQFLLGPVFEVYNSGFETLQLFNEFNELQIRSVFFTELKEVVKRFLLRKQKSFFKANNQYKQKANLVSQILKQLLMWNICAKEQRTQQLQRATEWKGQFISVQEMSKELEEWANEELVMEWCRNNDK